MKRVLLVEGFVICCWLLVLLGLFRSVFVLEGIVCVFDICKRSVIGGLRLRCLWFPPILDMSMVGLGLDFCLRGGWLCCCGFLFALVLLFILVCEVGNCVNMSKIEASELSVLARLPIIFELNVKHSG